MAVVFFTDSRESYGKNVFRKIDELLENIQASEIMAKNDLVAVKLHFGEIGNTGYLNPQYVAHVAKKVKELGARPFLTDGSTLYKGGESDAVTHLTTAIKHGFNYATIDAPLIIADGLRGTSCVKVEVDGKHCTTVEVASEVYNADALVCLTHFKAHPVAGIGGALKNVGMGLASKAGKLKMHSTVSPSVNAAGCIYCKRCFEVCPVDAIVEKSEKAFIQSDVCIGCGQCIHTCPVGAVRINWDSEPRMMMEVMVEHVKGILKNKKGKSVFINFIEKVTKDCDCVRHTDLPVVQDVGIACSVDPVSIDKASADLVNEREGLSGTALRENFAPGEDKFLALHPNVDWKIQIEYAEKMGVGEAEYEIKRIK